MIKLVGYPISPFVRKVRVGLEMKGVDYDIDPLNPYLDKSRIYPLNPSGTVPVLVNDDEIIPDSSSILHWLDDHFVDQLIYPESKEQRTHSEKLEEGADYQLMTVFGGSLFFQRVILPYYFKREGHDEYVQHALKERAPLVLKQLNEVVPEENYMVGHFSAADIAMTSWVRAGLLSGVRISETELPNLHAYLKRSYAQPAYAKVIESENNSEVIQWAVETWQLEDSLLGLG